MKSHWKRSMAALCAAGTIALIAGCGGSADTTIVTETRGATIGGSLTAPTAGTDSGAAAGSSSGGEAGNGGPIMPNVDESQVEAVTLAAITAYEREWGDGSGVNVVWGPNINSGWALAGLENNSGVAGKDVLLAQENGAWNVKDMGHALSVKWEGQTPAALWPSM